MKGIVEVQTPLSLAKAKDKQRSKFKISPFNDLFLFKNSYEGYHGSLRHAAPYFLLPSLLEG